MEKLINLDLDNRLKQQIVDIVNNYDDDTFENEYNNLISNNERQEDTINKAFEILFNVESASNEASLKKKKKKKYASKSKQKSLYSSFFPTKTIKKTVSSLKLAKSVKSSRPTRSSSSRKKNQKPWWKLF